MSPSRALRPVRRGSPVGPMHLVGALLLLAGLACSSSDTTTPRNPTFTATLSPDDEPSLPHPSQGSGTATFVFDGASLSATLTVQNMDSVTAAHIHRSSDSKVVLPLYTGSVVAHIGNAQVLVQKSFVAGDIVANLGISMDSLVALMRAGATYVNVHTKANPAGEIRGPITLKP